MNWIHTHTHTHTEAPREENGTLLITVCQISHLNGDKGKGLFHDRSCMFTNVTIRKFKLKDGST